MKQYNYDFTGFTVDELLAALDRAALNHRAVDKNYRGALRSELSNRLEILLINSK